MIKRIVPIAMLGMAFVSLNACKNNSFQKTKDGLEYNIVKDEKGDKKPVVGDIVTLHVNIRYKDDKTDTVFVSTRKMNNNQPIEIPLTPAPFKGDWLDGLQMLTAGDSAVFRVSVDSVRKMSGGQLPPFMKNGQKIQYEVKMVKIKTQEEAKQEQEAASSKQNAIDDQVIQEYLSKNNIQAQKTASGLYYTISKEGSGPTPTAGQKITVNYTGKTMDGQTFDSNMDPKFGHTQPFTFPVGQRQVIPGWDEGLMLLKKGSVAKLFIPSSQAYGAQGSGPIGPNSILIFDVEVTDIQ